MTTRHVRPLSSVPRMTMRLRALMVAVLIAPLAVTAVPAGARLDPGTGATVPRAAGLPADRPGAASPRMPRTTAGFASGMPVPRPASTAIAPVGGRVLRPFDAPATPYGPGHRGVDLAAVPGEPVRAALAGSVRFAGRVAGVTWVTVVHADGLATTYGGFVATVRAGDRVAMGTPLGHAGPRGRLDWGARRDGAYIDPLSLLGVPVIRLVPVGAR
jgi:murein DD-endopeptidase MepM/ murein hydrolase activator NlpD